MLTVATSFNFTQSTAAMIWEVAHNLNTTSPIVDCYILVDGSYNKIIPNEVVVIDANNIEIQWTEARSGKARLI